MTCKGNFLWLLERSSPDLNNTQGDALPELNLIVLNQRTMYIG